MMKELTQKNIEFIRRRHTEVADKGFDPVRYFAAILNTTPDAIRVILSEEGV